MLMITEGSGKHRVQLEKQFIGDHLLLILQGGQRPHIGAMVVCEPGKEPALIRLGTHKDHIVLTPIAEMACKKYKTTVVAVGGIHIDDATENDIEQVIKNCKRLESCI